MDYLNEKEIRYISPARAGYHAVVYWILEHHPSPSMFLNISVRNKVHRLRRKHPFKYTFDAKYTGYSDDEIVSEVQSTYNNELDGAKPKKLFIHSIESPFEWPNEIDVINQREETRLWHRGDSKEIYDILHIRDPFNLLASKLRQKENTLDRFNYFWAFERVWKGMAREIVGETSYLDNPDVDGVYTMNYNEWFLNEDYRASFAHKIGLDETCRQQYQKVRTGPGQGSSFDSFKYVDKAQKMKLMERYKTKIGEWYMKKLVDDEEIVELAKEIWKDSKFDIEKVIDEVRSAH